MNRKYIVVCPNCHKRYSQDFEDPDECPRCGFPDTHNICIACGREISLVMPHLEGPRHIHCGAVDVQKSES